MKPAVIAAIVISLTGCIARKSQLQDYGVVPSFDLTSHRGENFHSSKLAGKIWVADFIYTSCPGPCPRLTSQMREVQNAVIRMPDVNLVSFSVDPSRDTPQVLAQYAKERGATFDSWHFLTGSPDTLQKLDRDAFKLGTLDGTLQHSTRFVLVDRRSHIRGYYDTSESTAIPKLVSDIYALARERS